MEEENKDLNNEQVVTGQKDLNNADSVNQSDLNKDAGVVNQQNQDEVLADGTSADKTVKYSEMQKQVEARKAAEEQTAYAQRQLELIQANAQQNVQHQEYVAPKTTMEQALVDLGLTADDLYGENVVKVQNRKDQLDAANMQKNQYIMMNRQFAANHPDIPQVVGSVNPATGQIMTMSPELMQILTKKPYLAGACTTLQASYDIVIQERKLSEYEKTASINNEHIARKNADVNTQPLGGSAAGGGGAGSQSGQQLMTREQVQEIQRQIDAGEI